MSLKTTKITPRYSKKNAFTLIEVILVIVLISIISSLIFPNIINSRKGIKLTSTAKIIEKFGKYARGMSIIREVEHSIVIDSNRNIIYVGDKKKYINHNVDLKQEDIKIESGVNEEVRKYLPKGLIIEDFSSDKENILGEDDIFYINFYPNGYCDEVDFIIKAENKKINLKSNSMTGKIKSKFIQ